MGREAEESACHHPCEAAWGLQRERPLPWLARQSRLRPAPERQAPQPVRRVPVRELELRAPAQEPPGPERASELPPQERRGPEQEPRALVAVEPSASTEEVLAAWLAWSTPRERGRVQEPAWGLRQREPVLPEWEFPLALEPSSWAVPSWSKPARVPLRPFRAPVLARARVRE